MVTQRLHNDARGFALVATLMVMVLISVLIVTAFSGAMTVIRTTNLDYRNSRVFHAAEAGAEAIMAQLADALEDGEISDAEIAALTQPTMAGFTFSALNVNKQGVIVIETITDGPYAGLYSLTQMVEIFSEAEDYMGNESGVIISAKAQAIPIFQFGVFFEKDLEATNGPPMDFEGWVHSNGNVYLSSNNAWYYDMITTPNKIFHDRKDNHSVKNGVFILNAVADSVMLDFDSRSHPDPAAFRSESDIKFDNRVKTDAYEVDSLKVPLPPGMDPVAVIEPRVAGDDDLTKQAKFAWKADTYVAVDLANLSTNVAVCGGKGAPQPPSKLDETDVTIAAQNYICSGGGNITFHATHPDLSCGDFGMGATVKIDAEDWQYDGPMTSCVMQVTITEDTETLIIEVLLKKDDYPQFAEDQKGKATWYLDEDNTCVASNNTPWPDITVTRPAGMVTPNKVDKCNMFQWDWAAFYESREQDYSDILNVDIGQISAWAAGGGNRQVEVLYVEFILPATLTGYDPNALTEMKEAQLDPAIRVRNGATLPNRMTIATHYPLYVQGDYNKNNWVPSALVGDAITMLSNVWDDADHVDPKIVKPNAASTEYWAAVLAGHSATPCDHEVAGCPGGYSDFYGGGIENYLRFLEKWSGETATYRGSLVSLHESATVDGTWNGTYYSPPKRDWRFDTRFEDPANLPPGTPVVGNVIRTAFRPLY